MILAVFFKHRRDFICVGNKEKYNRALKSRGSSKVGDLSNLSPNSIMRGEMDRRPSTSVAKAIDFWWRIVLKTDDCSTWHSMKGIPLFHAALPSAVRRVSLSLPRRHFSRVKTEKN